MFGLFLEAWHIMGYSHSPDMTGATINRHPETYWWWVVMCFTVGLGFRIVGFRWITQPCGILFRPWSSPVLWACCCLTYRSNLIATSVTECIIWIRCSAYLPSPDSRPDWWRGTERARWITEWLRFTGKAVFFFIAYAVVDANTRSHDSQRRMDFLQSRTNGFSRSYSV